MKVALVTGAGRGLGREFAEFLTASGYAVYAGIHSSTDDDLAKLPNVRVVKLDVQSDSSIAEAISLIEKEQGRIDLLINNAGLIL